MDQKSTGLEGSIAFPSLLKGMAIRVHSPKSRLKIKQTRRQSSSITFLWPPWTAAMHEVHPFCHTAPVRETLSSTLDICLSASPLNWLQSSTHPKAVCWWFGGAVIQCVKVYFLWFMFRSDFIHAHPPLIFNSNLFASVQTFLTKQYPALTTQYPALTKLSS